MAKEQGIEVEGKVTEERGSGFFTVVLDNGHKVIARLRGKMEKKNKIKLKFKDIGLGSGSEVNAVEIWTNLSVTIKDKQSVELESHSVKCYEI